MELPWHLSAYALIKILSGKVDGVSPAIWVVAVLSVYKFRSLR